MKNWTIGRVIFLISSPLFAQQHDLHLLDSLFPNLSYHLDTDSLAELSMRRGEPPIVYFKDSMIIGCYQPVKVKPVFSLSIGHQFLFEEFEEYNSFIKEEKVSTFKIVLYAVEKTNDRQDSLLLNALQEYCIYGQTNYFFQSKDYILFNYAYAINGEGVVRYFRELGFWNTIENRLVKNLNNNASLAAKTVLPLPNDNLFHKAEIIKGKFLSSSGGLPSKKVKTPNGELHITGLPSTSHTFMNLKNGNRGVVIKNYNQPVANHYRHSSKWFMDNHYIYVYNQTDGFKTFRIHNQNILMHISENYGFSRVLD